MVTKRPHFVPKTYLRAWADSAGQVSYRRRDSERAIPNGIGNVAVAGGIYGVGDIGQARERLFNQVEDDWASLRFELTTRGDLYKDRRSALALFLALQLMRTEKHREQTNFAVDVAARTNERPVPKAVIRQHFQELDGGTILPDDEEVEAAWDFINGSPGIPTADEAFGVAAEIAVTKVAPTLEAMNWTVHKYRRPVLWSSDCPVHYWRRPTDKPHYGGIGIGNADEVRFPLSPGALLVMTRQTRPSPALPNPRAVNAEIGKQCHKFVFATKQSIAALEGFELSERSPRLRFRSGPGYRRRADGTDEYLGEVIHQFVE